MALLNLFRNRSDVLDLSVFYATAKNCEIRRGRSIALYSRALIDSTVTAGHTRLKRGRHFPGLISRFGFNPSLNVNLFHCPVTFP